MQLRQSSVYIDNVRLHACHGVLEQEQTVGNDYLLSAELVCDIAGAMATDELAGTVNYADVYEIVKHEMLVPSKLLEHVVGRIGEKLFTAFPSISEIKLSLTKVNPPMGADCDGAGVKVHLVRDDIPVPFNK